MTLVSCKECQGEISDKASACPQCGAKIKHFKWWLWLPLGAVLAFLVFGASIPQHEADARAARKACEAMYARGAVSVLYECTQIYDKMMAAGPKK